MTSYYPGQKIINLKTNDFTLDETLKIGIKEKILSFVLFLDDSKSSHKIAVIWDKLSTSVAGAKFCICDLLKESDIANSFSSLANDHNSKFRKFATQIPPFILAYREGEPTKKYLAVMSEHDIRHWCLNEISGFSLVNHSDNFEDEHDFESEKDLPKIV